MASITEQQFVLATVGIPLWESERMVDFEREAYVDLAMKEKKMQIEIMTAILGGGVSRSS